jgi:hypothetical protein
MAGDAIDEYRPAHYDPAHGRNGYFGIRTPPFCNAREAGDGEQTEFWQRVEAVLREMRGPHQS